jgi:hypothetical protein
MKSNKPIRPAPSAFLGLIFCSSALLSPLLLMRLITALSGCTALMLIRDGCGLVDQISLGQANPQLVFRELTRYCEHLEKRRRHFSSSRKNFKAG